MKHFVQYKIQRQGDNSYNILMIDNISNKKTIHSRYDTFPEAEQALEDLMNELDRKEAAEFLRRGLQL